MKAGLLILLALPSAASLTCLQVKAEYQLQSCCGNPGQEFNLPSQRSLSPSL
jgi:hypothetical protein